MSVEFAESRDRDNELHDLAPIGYLTVDRLGTILESNLWAAELLGVERADFVGRPLATFMSQADGEVFRAHLQDVFTRFTKGGCDLFLWPEGAQRGRGIPVHIDSMAFADDRGERATCRSVLIDLSDIRAAEEDTRAAKAGLRTSEAQTEALLDTAADAIVSSDAQGRVESFNTAAQCLFGYQEREVLGRDVAMLMSTASREELLDGRPGSTVDAGKNSKAGREVTGLRSDGTTVPLEVGIGDWLDQGVRKHTFIFHDVTARKAAEEALRTERDFAELVVETAPAVVLVLDLEGRIVRFNRHLVELSGYMLSQVRGADWFATFLAERDRARIREVFERVKRREPTAGTVSAIVTADGGEREIEWHNAVLEGATGVVSGVLAVGLDITERLRLEREFLQAQKMEAVGRLAGGIAHDFNNLLMGILGCCRIATTQVGDAHAARPLLDDIAGEAERAVGLTRQLLAFSRQREIVPRSMELDGVVENAHRMLSHLVGEDIALHVSLTAAGGPIVADPSQVEQVLMNLVVNARDAMPRGGELFIETAAVDLHGGDVRQLLKPGRYITLAVRDTGVGMDAQTQAKIFEPFFTTKPVGQGTGLGLSSAYAIVERLGGRIRVESAPGKGARFVVFFLRDESPSRSAPRSEPVAVARGAGETVLVVEDERLVRAAIRRTLLTLGYRVREARDGEEALRVCAEQEGGVDLLLTDIVLPGISGRDLARKIQATGAGVAMLYMSAYSNECLVEQGRLEVGEPSLQKPFDDQVLAARVRELLDDREIACKEREDG